jgi:hypothetical protein
MIFSLRRVHASPAAQGQFLQRKRSPGDESRGSNGAKSALADPMNMRRRDDRRNSCRTSFDFPSPEGDFALGPRRFQSPDSITERPCPTALSLLERRDPIDAPDSPFAVGRKEPSPPARRLNDNGADARRAWKSGRGLSFRENEVPATEVGVRSWALRREAGLRRLEDFRLTTAARLPDSFD